MELRRRFLKLSDIARETKSVIKSWFNENKEQSVLPNGIVENKEQSVLPNGIVENYYEEGNVFGYSYKCLGTFEGYKVLHSTELMREANTYFGAVFYTFPLNDGSIERVISVDSWFDTLSTNAQKSILYHEVGHLKDARGREAVEEDSMVRVTTKTLVDSEKIADDYAVSQMGQERFIKAMEEIIAALSGTFISIDELSLRIKRIKEEASC